MNGIPASMVQRGIGKGRDPWLIRRFLAGLGLTMKAVADMAGTRKSVVCDTVYGIRNHRRTLDQLAALGCPPDLLYPQQYGQQGRAA